MAPTPTPATRPSLPASSISYTEPHPSISSTQNAPRISSGIGGAGNITRYNRENLTAGPNATGPASALRSSISSMASGKARASSDAHHSASLSARRPSTASSASSTTSTSSGEQRGRKVFAGRGGAGNAKPSSERRIFSFDEELERQQRLADNASSTPIFHVGRGGAGNAFADAPTGPAAVAINDGTSGGVAVTKKGLGGVRDRVARAFARE